MLVSLGRWLIIVALVVSTGGHWAFLQTCAWAGMVLAYAQDGTFAEAISKTFDGDHPCKLCKIVKKGRQSDQEKPAALTLMQKSDLLLESHPLILYPRRVVLAAPAEAEVPQPRRESPPVPPPILA